MFKFGEHIFPQGPTSYSIPGVKDIDIAYAVDGTMLATSALYNQNELTLTWENVINDVNGIVSYLKNFVRHEIRDNNRRGGAKFFEDGMNIFRGYATLVGSTMSINKYGASIRYTISLTFRLR